ncbi:methyl-accepting chemotaxis protein [Marinomonas epiphytica]
MSLSVIQRIVLGFTCLVVLLLLITASGFFGISKLESRLKVVTGEVTDLVAYSNLLSEELSLLNTSMLQYLLSNSPDSLQNLESSFQEHRGTLQKVSDDLAELVEGQEIMTDALATIQNEARVFFANTDTAFQNHKRMLEINSNMQSNKVDLKDSLSFAVEDLAYLEEDGESSETRFAAAYLRSQMESLQVTVNDYFDETDLALLANYRESMNAVITNIQSKQSDMNDDNINELITEVESGVSLNDGTISQFYEYHELKAESERTAQLLAESADNIKQQSAQLLAQATAIREAAEEEASNVASLSVTTMGAVSLVSVVIAVLVAIWVSKSIRRPLGEVMAVLAEIAKGDFTQRSQVKTKDEFGELSKWVNDLVENLQGLIKSINQTANQVAESAHENVQRSGGSKKLMSSQNDQTTSVASAMTEMVATVQEVEKSTEVTFHQIQSVDQRATENRSKMEANIQEVEVLVEKIEHSVEVVNQLDEYSQNIGRILEVIQGIAEQTNLLALNAAIEAARAGEQGRGFAVVADEVRTLATRTHDSTEEIQNVIGQLQKGVKETVVSMEACCNSAHSSVAETRMVGESLAELQECMQEIRDMSTQISTAAGQQSVVAQDINRSIHDISSMSEQASDSADQSEQSSTGLASLASHQKDLLSKFKV